MADCSACGTELTRLETAFTCSYCGRIHCTEHRMPEAHGCPEIRRATTLGPDVRGSEGVQTTPDPPPAGYDWGPEETTGGGHPDPPGWKGWLVMLVILLGLIIAALNAFGAF